MAGRIDAASYPIVGGKDGTCVSVAEVGEAGVDDGAVDRLPSNAPADPLKAPRTPATPLLARLLVVVWESLCRLRRLDPHHPAVARPRGRQGREGAVPGRGRKGRGGAVVAAGVLGGSGT